MAVLAFPYADETAVPIDENCPLTAWVVDAMEPVTPAAVPAPVANDDADLSVRVGQMEARAPGVDVQPEIENAKLTIATLESKGFSRARVFLENVIDKIAYSAPNNYVIGKIIPVVTPSAIGSRHLEQFLLFQIASDQSLAVFTS